MTVSCLCGVVARAMQFNVMSWACNWVASLLSLSLLYPQLQGGAGPVKKWWMKYCGLCIITVCSNSHVPSEKKI